MKFFTTSNGYRVPVFRGDTFIGYLGEDKTSLLDNIGGEIDVMKPGDSLMKPVVKVSSPGETRYC